MTTTAITALENLPAKRPDAIRILRQIDTAALVQLAYGEDAPTPLMADVPCWLAEAAYDELDRRDFGTAS